MKKTFRHITVFLLAGIVFFSTTGLSVHHLYCYCKGEMITSILVPDNPCELGQGADRGNCCEGGACHLPGAEQKHNCTESVAEYVKLDTPFLLPVLGFDLTMPFVQLPAYFFFNPTAIAPVLPGMTWEQDTSPPAGRELLVLIQSFLC